jgi:5-methylcytosine-specific restriction protein A
VNEPTPPPEPMLVPEHLYLASPDMAQIVSDELVRSFGQPRASGWSRLRDDWIKEHPACAVCGTESGCVPHHVVPVHVDPTKELDRDNLVTLCPPDHLMFGHLKNWASWNCNVKADANYWHMKIACRPEKKGG